MSNNSLIEFSNAVMYRASEDKRLHSENLINECRRIIEEHTKALEKKNFEIISEEKNRLENEKTTSAAKHKQEIKKKLAEKRNSLVEGIFSKAEEKLLKYTKTDEYLLKLKSDFQSADNRFSDEETVVCVRECDISFLKTECGGQNFIFEAAKDDIIGGFTLLNKKLRIFADFTFKTRLEQEKQSFALKADFVID